MNRSTLKLKQTFDIFAADLREIFNLIDVDRSGHLSFDEFSQVIRCSNPNAEDAEITRAIQKVDTIGTRLDK